MQLIFSCGDKIWDKKVDPQVIFISLLLGIFSTVVVPVLAPGFKALLGQKWEPATVVIIETKEKKSDIFFPQMRWNSS